VACIERENAMREAEEQDLDAGRIRLADLDNSADDYDYGQEKGKMGKKKGKRGKKGGKYRQQCQVTKKKIKLMLLLVALVEK